MNIIYRKNMMFVINDSELPKNARTTDIKNALYADVYEEFRGASQNKLYKDLSYSQKMKKLNEFAEKWLKDKGLL